MNRRHTDLPGHEPETREATLEVLVDHYRNLRDQGSTNFRRYRKWATFLFVTLAAVATLEGYLIWKNNERANHNLAMSVRQITLDSCRAGNDLRAGLRAVAKEGTRGTLQELALASFQPRDCEAVAAEIEAP